jgi:predicted CoA-binding protein
MEKRTLVIGASENTSRYSNRALLNLRRSNIETFAIGVKKGKVLDVSIETEKKYLENVDTVTLYLNPTRQKEYHEYILSLHPKRVIFNPGTENVEFEKILQENSIAVERACTLVLLATNQF